MSNGKIDQAKGRVKQAAGDLTDNDELRHEGKVDEQAGKVKDVLDNATDKAQNVVDDVKDALKKDSSTKS
jgi:uncharacterized protein YjbJ (UPF0337 family)